MDLLALATHLGDIEFTLILVVVSLFLNPHLGKKLALAAILVIMIVGPTKIIIAEPRPCEGCDNLSFPSYHAASSFTNAVLLGEAFPPMAPLFFVIATTVAYSRLYLNVHTVLDVVVGALLGLAVGVAMNRLYKGKKDTKKRK